MRLQCIVLFVVSHFIKCALCGRAIFSVISVLLTMENSNDLEIRVPDGSRSLKVKPVNFSCYFLLVINCTGDHILYRL